MNCLDHIVIAAASLAQGVDYLRAELGVEVPAGGQHQAMATHNHLMQLGDGRYLELIAIDPDAGPPPYPRWFGLDQQQLRAALVEQPRLITWVVNTPDLQQMVARAGFDIGVPTRLSRDRLEWEFALTDDGRLLADGLLPYCIQWHSSPHPAASMVDPGCRLERLVLHHNRPDWLAARLDALNARHLADIDPLPDSQSPYLTADIRTPAGHTVTLSSHP